MYFSSLPITSIGLFSNERILFPPPFTAEEPTAAGTASQDLGSLTYFFGTKKVWTGLLPESF